MMIPSDSASLHAPAAVSGDAHQRLGLTGPVIVFARRGLALHEPRLLRATGLADRVARLKKL